MTNLHAQQIGMYMSQCRSIADLTFCSQGEYCFSLTLQEALHRKKTILFSSLSILFGVQKGFPCKAFNYGKQVFSSENRLLAVSGRLRCQHGICCLYGVELICFLIFIFSARPSSECKIVKLFSPYIHWPDCIICCAVSP